MAARVSCLPYDAYEEFDRGLDAVAQEVLGPLVRPFDWPWDEYETIWPCRDCKPWRAELLLAQPHGAVWVREWHALDCPIWAEIAALDL